jgi:UDP-N-acetylglucosamine 2-epimerase (non-hydrolysing)
MLLQLVFGTRPEIIKMAPIIRACQAKGVPLVLTCTGQHYDHQLIGIFLEELDLPTPDENMHVGSGMHGAQTGRMLALLEESFHARKPNMVLAQGDTNSVLAAALASTKLHIPFGHIEAGLRSRDRQMPEEINRILADHCAELCFAPTEEAAANLCAENIPESRVALTGNTIADASLQHLPMAEARGKALRRLGLTPRQFVIVTCHRDSNVDDPGRLSEILRALGRVAQHLPVALPLHPRTRDSVQRNGLENFLAPLKVTEPLGYLDFLQLLAEARFAITDSGGVQEEASILQTPCLTIRDSTERPETVRAGVNRVIGMAETAIVEHSLALIHDENVWESMRGHPHLFGDGRAGARIVARIVEFQAVRGAG